MVSNSINMYDLPQSPGLSTDFGLVSISQATCCADQVHCCPSDYHCDDTGSKCVKSDGTSWELSLTQYTRTPAKYARTPMETAPGKVQCPDKKSTCPDGTTCCLSADKKYECCPFTQVGGSNPGSGWLYTCTSSLISVLCNRFTFLFKKKKIVS